MMRWTILLLMMALTLWSAPAFSEKRQFQQPDGTLFSGRLQGDEYLSWIETDAGEILLYDKQHKRFEHAVVEGDDLKASGVQYSKGKPPVEVIERSRLMELWKLKRDEAMLRRKNHFSK